MSPERVSERKGNGHILAEDRKGVGTNSGKSGTSNL